MNKSQKKKELLEAVEGMKYKDVDVDDWQDSTAAYEIGYNQALEDVQDLINEIL